MEIKEFVILLVDELRLDCIGAEREKCYLARYGLEKLIHTPPIDYFANTIQ